MAFLLLMVFFQTKAQTFVVKGRIVEQQTQAPIPKVKVYLTNFSVETSTDNDGFFSLKLKEKGDYNLSIQKEEYLTKSLDFSANSSNTELGSIILERNLIDETAFIILSESEVEDDESSADAVSGLLQSSRDIFMRRAAFDFGQVFFKPRGYDSRESSFIINGIPMNKVYNGRPQWSNWGGLNDVMRNTELSTGITPSEYDFGGLFGNTYVNLSPSINRAGLRISSSASNRTYIGRIMATYNSGSQTNGFSYSLSGSRRWAAHSGYFDGTSYNAYSLFGSAEYKLNPHHKIMAAAMFTPNRRGKSAVVTKEVSDLAGHKYNPYWGWQGGKKRNSRMKEIIEPLFIFSYEYNKNNTNISANLGYQFGQVGNTRIQYGNGQNPEPHYYKSMPSYYLNDPNGTNLRLANLQKEYFLSHSQLDWASIYRANSLGSADKHSIFILSEDINEDKTLTGNLRLSTQITDNIQLNAGITYQNVESENFAEINDLLGGNYFLNKSYFNGKSYDKGSELKRHQGDRYQYNYVINSDLAKAFAELRFKYGKADFYIGSAYQYSRFQREGLYDSESHKNSKGKSAEQTFYGLSSKAGITYSLSGRHMLQANAAYLVVPQNTRNMFANIRFSNLLIPDLENETQYTADASYIIRMPYLKMRLTGYFTEIKDASETNFFYTQAAISDNVSSDFLNLTTKGIEKRHFGLEFGAEAQIIPTVKATAAVAIGQHTYNNNPSLYLSSDDIGLLKIKKAYLKNYKLASGPQHAYSIGLEYRSPKYWWAGVTANMLTHNYVAISHLYRTDNFFRDPKTNSPFSNINEEKARELLTQEKVDDLFLLNFTAGKSWRVKRNYISLFVSVNNLLNKKYMSGGFEQTRTANYQGLLRDNAQGVPTFGPRYFRGYGRTVFINLAISL